MLSLIQRVGELLIQVEVNRSLGDKERVSDLYLDAYDEVFNAGLDACLMDKTKKYHKYLKLTIKTFHGYTNDLSDKQVNELGIILDNKVATNNI